VNRRALGGAVGVLALVLVVYGGSGLLRVWRMQREVEALEREIAALRGQNQDLARTVDRLRSDPAEIERIAREELGFVRPGEKVLKFPPSPRTLP
jgi:cell division protein FtsB